MIFLFFNIGVEVKAHFEKVGFPVMWVLECSTFTSYPASLNNGFFKIHKLLNYLNLDFWSNSLELYLNFPQSYFNRFIKVRVLVSTYLRTVEMSG